MTLKLQEQPSRVVDRYCFLSSQGRVSVAGVSVVVYLEQEMPLFFFPMIRSTQETTKKIPTYELLTVRLEMYGYTFDPISKP
jgi:hypothetical protein